MSAIPPQLTPLLPTPPLRLSYAIPLLLLSLVFTFAGTFLTLDRSRSFPARYTGGAYTSLPVPGALDTPKAKRRFVWALEGGVGGLVGGFLFGVHLSTALALLIPATTPEKTLAPKAFVAVWLLSTIVTTPLAGRYRYAAYTFFGVSGGSLISLALCMIIHPSLPSRTILTTTFLCLFTLLSLLFASIPRLSNAAFHPFLRVCTASTGAFGVVVSIALLLNPMELAWANVWERLWVKDGEIWGNGREQGLSAAFGIFFAAGIAADWALHRWIGECPDEKWDNYLAHYAANLPNRADRAGQFQPFASFWDRVFPSSTASVPSTPFELPHSKSGKGGKDMMFPNDADFKAHLALPFAMHNVAPGKLSKKKEGEAEENILLGTRGDLLKKKTKKRTRTKGFERGRKPVKFGADLSSDSDEEDEDDDKTKLGSSSKDNSVASTPTIQQKPAPWAVGAGVGKEGHKRPELRSYSSSAATLVDRKGQNMKHVTKQAPGDARLGDLATLDYEKEIEAVKDKLKRGAKKGGESGEEVEYSDYEEDLSALKGGKDGAGPEPWSPAFMKRHQSQTPSIAVAPGAVPVPATPSLIRAIDRITVAQRDAFGPSRDGSQAQAQAQVQAGQRPQGERTASQQQQEPAAKERAPRWEEFWREVKVKSQS